jgi:hypothetical protein
MEGVSEEHFLKVCRDRGREDGEYWAQGRSLKRLQISLDAPGGGLLDLGLHTEITVSRIADRISGNLEEGFAAFREGFVDGIRVQLKKREEGL